MTEKKVHSFKSHVDCDAFGWLEATNQRSRFFLCCVHTSEKEGVGTEDVFFFF